MSNRKLAILLAGCTAAVLVVMAIVAIATGATQEAHEHFALPEAYALGLLEHAKGLRAVMGLDVAFLVLYTAFFALLAQHLRARGASAVLVWMALGAMIGTALLDIVEDHHILTLLDEAEHQVLPSAGAIAFQATESATKFSLSFLSLVLFGLAIPRDSRLGIVLALFLTVGTLVSAVLGYAIPPASAAHVEAGRWIGFLAGFALAIAWLWKEPDPS
ncbi:MAG: hypothetical protein ACM31C_24400 [Acidobacteriota bacterium]